MCLHIDLFLLYLQQTKKTFSKRYACKPKIDALFYKNYLFYVEGRRGGGGLGWWIYRHKVDSSRVLLSLFL